jgi:hypothetical protein
MVKTGLEARITLHLEVGGQSENEERADRGGDNLDELEHGDLIMKRMHNKQITAPS